MPEPNKQSASIRSRLAIAAVAALIAANVVVPLLWGDVYPFTSAPMFRDSPRHLCNYRIYSPSGEELPLVNWNLERVYDGNPVGYGVSVRPPNVLEQEFGVVHDEATVRQHVEQQFWRLGSSQYEFVDVVQDVIGAKDNQRVGIVATNRWRIDRPASVISDNKLEFAPRREAIHLDDTIES
jgi:hypothetical protein